MKNIQRLAVVVLASCLWAAPGVAEEEDGSDEGFGHSGFYIGVNAALGFGNFYEDSIEDNTPLTVNVDDSWGLNARVGYRLTSFFALEANYEYMDEFSIEVKGLPDVDQTTHTLTGNLKFLIPIWRFHPYLMLGAGGQYYDFKGSLADSIDDETWVFAARPAVGLDLYITRNFLLNVEGAGVIALSDFDDELSSIDTLPYVSLSAGLQWRF